MPAFSNEYARYAFQFDNMWSEDTHPGAFPHAAHFSWVGGGTHNDQLSLWRVGEVASPAMVEMAETGETTLLTQRILQAVQAGNAFSVIDQKHWICPQGVDVPACGSSSFEVEINSDFPLVSAVTMLGPSPDWFVGVSGLSLRESDRWIDEIVVGLYPYDGGTRSANEFKLKGPQNEPPEPITHITIESGQLITDRLLGTLTISRVIECDLDGDYVCSAADIDFFNAAYRATEPTIDLDRNGEMDEEDRRYWVEQLMSTKFGDANLDGLVGFDDFVAVANGFGKSGGWADGDFTGTGFVDFDDFLALADNYNQSPQAVSVVPEPQFVLPRIVWIATFALCRWPTQRRASRGSARPQ